MGQILHSRATTTEAVRRAIQNSQESINELAEKYAVIPKQPENAGLDRAYWSPFS